VGKTIPAESEKIKSKREVKRLREDLEKAIEREEFERAAKLRDQIREIEEKMS